MKLYCSIGAFFRRGAICSAIIGGVDDGTLLKLLVGARFCTLGYDAEGIEFESVDEIRGLLSTHEIDVTIYPDGVSVALIYHVPDKIVETLPCYQCEAMSPLKLHNGRWRCEACIKGETDE